MKRFVGWTLIVILLAVAALGGLVYSRLTSLAHEQVTGDVWMISGMGSNVSVLRTTAGTVIVDTMTTTLQGDRIKAMAAQLAGRPVVLVINTHWHLDHTHGNPSFTGDVRVVSTKRTREHLVNLDAEYWEGEAAATLPSETFEHEHTIPIGGKTIRLLHPGRGHTDGDLVALFVEDRVLATGDLLFNELYPNIDLEAGGTVRAWPQTLDEVAGLEFDRVIPGHGPVTDRHGIARFRAFLVELGEKAADAAKRGWGLEQTLEAIDLRADEGFEDIYVPFILTLDRDFVVTRAWQEATGSVRPYDAAENARTTGRPRNDPARAGAR